MRNPQRNKASSPHCLVNSAFQRMHQTTGFRSLFIWFFLTSITIYLLYYSNLIRFRNESRNCATNHDLGTGTTENLQTRLNFSNTTILGDDDDDDDDDNDTHMETKGNRDFPVKSLSHAYDTELKHIVFGIAASSNLWDKRKEYIKTWWRPNETRGVVWLDKNVSTAKNESLPEIRISKDTSRFKYTNPHGHRSALRLSRVVSETVRLGMKDVRWFVMGDDDTVFLVDNVVSTLAKYDHRQFYYLGSVSESHIQNVVFFSYAMAYGGGGFAISYPLAVELSKMHERCLERYPNLYGSDDRIQACMAELGVPLTKEPGFHQYDMLGDLLGLLAAHPVTPLASLHHIDFVQPIFPKMSRVKSLQHLMQSVKLDSASVVQQSICYDRRRFWTISVSWGFVVQILRGVISPREMEMPMRTFVNWGKRTDFTAYTFNTRPVSKDPCQKPFVFYMNSSYYDHDKKQTVGTYFRHKTESPFCRWRIVSPDVIDTIVVVKKPDPLRWQKSPRRDCCRLLPTNRRSTMNLWVGQCQQGELSEF